MKHFFSFLAGVALCVSTAVYADDEINIQEAYKGSLPIDSTVVTNDDDLVLQKALYLYDEEQNVVGMQIYNYSEYDDSLVLSQDSRYEMRGDTIIEKFYIHDDYNDTTYCTSYREYCKDERGNLTYNALFSFHDYMGENGMWASERMEYMAYDEQNRITMLRLERFDYSNMSGTVLESITYYSYPDDNVRVEERWGYDPFDDVLFQETHTEYRIAGDSIMTINYNLDFHPDDVDVWEMSSIDMEIHHTPDSVTTYTAYANYEWIDDDHVFMGWNYRSRDRVVTGNRMKTIYTDHYEDSVWHIAYKEVFYYDAGGRTTARYTYYWDNEKNYLHPGWKYIFIYHTDGTQTTYDYYWDDEINDWKQRGFAPARPVVSESYTWDAQYRLETTTDADGTVLKQVAYGYNEDTELWDIVAYTRTYTYYYDGAAVVLTDDTPTAVDLTPMPSDQACKVLLNGQLYILSGDKTYTILGHMVK